MRESVTGEDGNCKHAHKTCKTACIRLDTYVRMPCRPNTAKRCTEFFTGEQLT